MSGIMFWFVALLVLAAVFVLWPLLAANKKKTQAPADSELAQRRDTNRKLYNERLAELDAELELKAIDNEQYQRVKAELTELLEQDSALPQEQKVEGGSRLSRGIVIACALVLPLLGAFLYWQWGAQADWEIYQLNAEKTKLQNRSGSPAQISELNESLRDKLEARVRDKPDNLQNWFLLARTAFELRDYGRSISAYRHIIEQEPNAAQVWNELAQVTYVASGNRFTPDVKTVFDRALSLNPHDSSLLGLAGLGAYEDAQYQLAIDYWQQAANGLAADDPRRETWDNAIGRAREAMGENGSSSSEVAESKEEAAPGLELQVSVRLGEGVEVKPTDTVFIYARAWQGPRMPLAIQRLTVAQLPATIKLSESMAMQAGMTIANFEQLEVVARVSAAGSAQAQPGDWQASAGPINPRANDQAIELTIDSQLP